MFESRHPIRFNHVDAAGLVYFPHFLHLCHATMEDFFNARSSASYADWVAGRRVGFPTVRAEADFRAPLRFGDTARVRLGVEHLGRTSITFRYDVLRDADGVECCRVRVVTVQTDLVNMLPLPLEEGLRSMLEAVKVPA